MPRTGAASAVYFWGTALAAKPAVPMGLYCPSQLMGSSTLTATMYPFCLEFWGALWRWILPNTILTWNAKQSRFFPPLKVNFGSKLLLKMLCRSCHFRPQLPLLLYGSVCSASMIAAVQVFPRMNTSSPRENSNYNPSREMQFWANKKWRDEPLDLDKNCLIWCKRCVPR